MIAAALTDVPGASDVFVGGVVAYDNEVKSSMLDVDPGTLLAHGAVSEETAAEMAMGIARATSAIVTVATTGIAGPDGGTDEKPVGLVCFGVWSPDGVRSSTRELFGDRAGVRTRATVAALDLLRLETL
jgi:PncC family amidohydrolase